MLQQQRAWTSLTAITRQRVRIDWSSGIGSNETASIPRTSGKKCRRDRQRAGVSLIIATISMSSKSASRSRNAHL